MDTVIGGLTWLALAVGHTGYMRRQIYQHL